MTSFGEAAKEYKPASSLTVADLEAVSISSEIKERVENKGQEDEYLKKFIVVDGVEYRVPNPVFKQLQAILKKKPDMKTFSVDKEGTGLNTTYTVIPLE